MDQETKELLRKILEVSTENNKMLKSVQRSMFWGRVMRYVYWAIIIGSAIGAYYFVQPYVDQVIGVYGGFKGGINSFFQ